MDYKPRGFQSLIANATYRDTKAAIAFYQKALGLTVKALLESPKGGVMHAATTIGGSQFFMNDEFEGSPQQASTASSVSFYLYVPDVDAAYTQAVQTGMTSVSPPTDMFWGDRTAVAKDPFGYTWVLATQVREVSQEEAIQAFKKMMA